MYTPPFIYLSPRSGTATLLPSLAHTDYTALSLLNTNNAFFGANQLAGTVPTALTALPATSVSTWGGNCLVNVSGRYPGCDVPERPALVDLYTATGGGSWATRTNWLSTTLGPCNGWYGVLCASVNASVTALSMPANNLVGPVPASISALTALKRVNLPNNYLTALPDEISGLTAMTSLVVAVNALTGPIPSVVTAMTALATLNLQNNALIGTIPRAIGSAASLRYGTVCVIGRFLIG